MQLELLETLVLDSPNFMVWKDRASTFMGGNKNMALAATYQKPADLVGKTDFDCPWDFFASDYQSEDKFVLSGHTVEKNKLFILSNKLTAIKVKKTPISQNNKIIGLVCYAEKLWKPSISSAPLAQNIYQGIEVPHDQIKSLFFNITPRESHVLFYLIRGYSCKSLSKLLSLSSRTVEAHCNHLKEKFKCFSKEALIQKAYQLGFHMVVPQSLPLNSAE